MGLFAGTPFDRPPRCERCDRLESECQCPPPVTAEVPPQKQTVRLQVENRKRGKQVTVLRGLRLSQDGLASLLTTLKNQCGAGGAIDDGVIEIQGSQVDRVRTALEKLGYQTR
jgi:translation initiation factor 1